MIMDKLKPCPFCGRMAETRLKNGFFHVVCANDGCYVRTDGCLNENEAVRLWNKRVAEPVRHGKWVLLDECSNHGVYCSVCYKKVYKDDYANLNVKSCFCPNCGARMA